MILISGDSYINHLEGNDGWCTKCKGWTVFGSVKPDAYQWTCPTCLRPTVFGATEAVAIGSIGVKSDKDH